MKKIYMFIGMALFCGSVFAQTRLIIATWNTENAGSTNNQSITIPASSNVEDMSSIWAYAAIFNQPLNNCIQVFYKVTNMSLMFSGSSLFNQDINNRDVHNVTFRGLNSGDKGAIYTAGGRQVQSFVVLGTQIKVDI